MLDVPRRILRSQASLGAKAKRLASWFSLRAQFTLGRKNLAVEIFPQRSYWLRATSFQLLDYHLQAVEGCFLVLQEFLSPCQNGLLLDIGANIGIFSIGLASPGCCRTLAFEPVPGTYQLLSANIALNPQLHVQALPVGLSSEPGLLRMETCSDVQNHVVGKEASTTSSSTQTLAFLTLDIVMESMGGQALMEHDRLAIKIDVERHERAVLHGGKSFLSQLANLPLPAMVVCEFFSDGNRLELQGLLQEAGFSPWVSTFELGNNFCMANAAAMACHPPH